MVMPHAKKMVMGGGKDGECYGACDGGDKCDCDTYGAGIFVCDVTLMLVLTGARALMLKMMQMLMPMSMVLGREGGRWYRRR